MQIQGYTPRQYAHDLAANWISAVYNRHTSDLQGLSDAQDREVRKYLAKLHERILSDARLDGMPLTRIGSDNT